MSDKMFGVVTVTLNPAIDRTVKISNFTAGKVNRVEETRSNAGGKGVNVASALADFGHEVAVTGFLGAENTTIFEELFDRKQISDLFVRVPGNTRVAIKVTDPVLRQTTEINFPGVTPDPANIKALHRQLDHLSTHEGVWFVLAGSVPPGMDPTIYRELISLLRSRRNKVVLDTSDEPLRHGLEAVPNVIKPNIHELEALLGKELDGLDAVIHAARMLINRGIEMVTVSMGPDGALFVTRDQVVVARPPSINVRSTVGAGDAMVAGIIAAQLRGLSLADRARMATAFSIETLVRGEAGVTSCGAIEAAMQEVTIEEPALIATT